MKTRFEHFSVSLTSFVFVLIRLHRESSLSNVEDIDPILLASMCGLDVDEQFERAPCDKTGSDREALRRQILFRQLVRHKVSLRELTAVAERLLDDQQRVRHEASLHRMLQASRRLSPIIERQ